MSLRTMLIVAVAPIALVVIGMLVPRAGIYCGIAVGVELATITVIGIFNTLRIGFEMERDCRELRRRVAEYEDLAS